MTVLALGPGQSRTFRTLWMLEEIRAEKNIDYEHQIKGYPTEEEGELLRSLNPMAQFPVIKDGDFVLRESMAINLYLAAKYDVLEPQSLESKSLSWQWSFWAMTAVETMALEAMYYTHGIMGHEKDADKVKEQVDALQRPLRVINDALGESEYLLGGEFSVADLNVASVMMWVVNAQIDSSAFPNLERWYEHCHGRDAAVKLRSQ